jgi:hypothetical protein
MSRSPRPRAGTSLAESRGMNRLVPSLLLAGALAPIVACAIDADLDPGDLDTDTAAIVDGKPAGSTSLDAIGTLAYDRSGQGEENTFCTGTLVGPREVLTTRGCLSELPPDKIFFIVGKASNQAPRRGFKVVKKVGGPAGTDFGLFQLKDEVTGVTPLPLASLSASQIGKRFQVTGFGTDENGEIAIRRAGNMTLRGLKGNVFDLLFGNFQRFLDEAAPELFPELDPDDADDLKVLHQRHDRQNLTEGAEAWFGGKDGEASVCDGDNGAPATATRSGKTTVFAIATRKLVKCQFGGGFNIVTPAVIDFVRRQTR